MCTHDWTHAFQTLARVCENLYNEKMHIQNPFYQPVHIHVMNPKSITMEELYGGIDKLTLEWRDGLMAITVRQAVQVRVLIMLKCN